MRLALIGHEIQHSLSPKLQGLNAKAWGDSVDFDLLDIKPNEFEAFIEKKSGKPIKGLM